MPDFENRRLWDDVVHPFFLIVGAYISSFGPFILVLVIGFYFVLSSASSEMEAFQANVAKIPGTPYYDSQRTVEQSEQVQGVLGDISDKSPARVETTEEVVPGETSVSPGEREAREQEEPWAMAQESRRQNLEAVIGKSPETQAKESEAMVQGFLNLAAPLVIVGTIFFLWGVFYFPAACAVAGYTRSFTATVNPLVGLDTIKRLGGAYARILLMSIALVAASIVVGLIAGAILSPFDLPGFGNLPARAIGAIFGFYLSVVFSCILGYAIFKNADKLEIHS